MPSSSASGVRVRPRVLRFAGGSRAAAIVVTALLGIAATVGAFLLVCSWEYRLAEIDFHSKADGALEIVNADLDGARTLLYTMAAFIGANERPLTRSEFVTFSKSLHRRVAGLRDTGWAPQVLLAERARFERDMRATIRPNFQIQEFGPDRRLIRAKSRPTYFVLLYGEGPSQTHHLYGFDLICEKIRAGAALRALATGGASATPPIDVATVARPGAGVLAYMPVYGHRQPRDRRPRVRGLVLGVFDLSEMVKNIFAREAALRGLDLYVYNPAAAGARRVIYATPSAPGAPVAESDRLAHAHVAASVHLIDQSIGTIVTPAVPLRFVRASVFATTTLIVGCTMTLMVVAYLLMTLRRTLELEALTASLQTTTDELYEKNEQITRISRHDALTGLPNRLLLQERMTEAIARLGRGEPFALLFLDLDRFKAVNDTLGHGAGDSLLCAVSERIRAELRDGDTAARLGGDEFAVILADIAEPTVIAEIANRLIDAISRPYRIGAHPVAIGVSIGAALATADAAVASIMAEADLAMYAAKESGRGVLRVFEPRMRSEVAARRTLELDLRKGLDRGEFEVHYHPSIELEAGAVVGFEALVRWQHPTRGLLLPEQFIGAAQECGLIDELGTFVLHTACRDAAGWPLPVNVSVNISPRQLDPVTLVRSVRAALETSGLAPSRLEIEVTEDSGLAQGAPTVNLFDDLHRLGVIVAIDDFGTGFSSLSSFLHLPFDKIKIDRSFIAGIHSSPGAAAIVVAIASLGRGLNRPTTAEGVETREQLDFLRAAGCSEAQGYYFCEPRPNSDVPALLASLARNRLAREVLA